MKNESHNNNSSPRLFIFLCILLSVLAAAVYIKFETGSSVGSSGRSSDRKDEADTFIIGEEDLTVSPEDLEATDEPMIPEPPKEYKHLSFVAAGDCLVHTNVYKYASQLASGTDAEYDFKPMFANIKPQIESADIAYINQETICGGKELGYSGYPTFNTPDEIAEALVDTGFDIINIANNHMLDKGERGLSRAIDFWREQPVTLLGGFKSKDEYNNITVTEHNGVKIAWLSYTYGTNGLVLPASSELCIPLATYEEIDRQTKEARELADLVFVSMHWGYEDNFEPNSEQIELAAMMAQNNVDAVIGMHPHVLQKLEWLPRPDGKETLVAYSLGNLLSTMMYGRNMLGGLLSFDIDETDDGYVLGNVVLTPTLTHYTAGFNQPTIWYYRDITEDMQQSHGAHRYDGSMSTGYLNGIITRCISHDFIGDDYYDVMYGITHEEVPVSTPAESIVDTVPAEAA